MSLFVMFDDIPRSIEDVKIAEKQTKKVTLHRMMNTTMVSGTVSASNTIVQQFEAHLP